jgi:outer membrane receptor for monomeric catechols
VRYFDNRQYHLVNQELRLWSDAGSRLGWMVGVSHLSARSDIAGTLLPADDGRLDVLQLAQHVQETAVFGEFAVPIAARMRATAGLRISRSDLENERALAQEESEAGSVENSATPSVALDFRSADDQSFFYLRFARANRPGGLNPAAADDEESDDSSRFAADELSNVDLGARLRFGSALALQGALFATRWSHIQSDYLLPNGLVGTRNAGNGRNFGIEASASWLADRRWRFEASVTLQHARLHRAEDEQPEDSRLPVVPDLRLRGSVLRTIALADWELDLGAEVNYTGAARLSFEEALDRRTPGYASIDSHISLRRAGLELGLHAANLFNSHADTFAFGNPFSIRSSTQHTPLRPRAVTLGITYGW